MHCERDSLGRLVGRSPNDLRGYTNKGRRLGPRLFKHFKIDQLLSAEEREQYELLLADPSQTIRSLQAWLAERGHTVSHNAVSNHRHHRFLEFKGERRMRHFAAAYCAMSRHYGAGAIVEANQAKIEMMLMENLFKEPGDVPTVTPKQLQILTKLAGSGVNGRLNVEQMRAVIDEAQRRADEDAKRSGKKQASPRDVVARMQEILGLRRADRDVTNDEGPNRNHQMKPK